MGNEQCATRRSDSPEEVNKCKAKQCTRTNNTAATGKRMHNDQLRPHNHHHHHHHHHQSHHSTPSGSEKKSADKSPTTSHKSNSNLVKVTGLKSKYTDKLVVKSVKQSHHSRSPAISDATGLRKTGTNKSDKPKTKTTKTMWKTANQKYSILSTPESKVPKSQVIESSKKPTFQVPKSQREKSRKPKSRITKKQVDESVKPSQSPRSQVEKGVKPKCKVPKSLAERSNKPKSKLPQSQGQKSNKPKLQVVPAKVVCSVQHESILASSSSQSLSERSVISKPSVVESSLRVKSLSNKRTRQKPKSMVVKCETNHKTSKRKNKSTKSNKSKSKSAKNKEKSELTKRKEIFMVGEVSRPPKMSSPVKTFKDDCLSLLPVASVSDEFKESIDGQTSQQLTKEFSATSKVLSDSEEAEADELKPIFKEEFEQLHDQLKDLNRAVEILRQSYRDIIQSLVKLSRAKSSQERKSKSTHLTMLTSVGDLPRIANAKSGDLSKSIAIEQPPSQIVEKSDKNLLRTGTGPHWPVVDGSKSSEEVAKVESCFTLDRFLNPITRDQTFNDLFNEVQMLNDSMARLNDFYDTDGDFDFEEYQNSDYRMKRPTFESLRQKSQMLLTIVRQITRVYNRDLLDMYRIK